MPSLKTLNLGAELPTVEEAHQQLLAEIRHAKQSAVIAVKIVQGYGCTWKGGALRGALPSSSGAARRKASSPA